MAAKTLKIDVHTPGGKNDGSVELPAELFDVEPNIALMHQVAEAQRAKARTRRRRAARFAVAARSRTARRAPVVPVRVRRALRSSPAVAPCTARSRATTASARPRR